MDDVSIRLEHVDLLNGLDRLYVQLLERCLKLLVVDTAGLMNLLDLSSWGTLSSVVLLSASMYPKSPSCASQLYLSCSFRCKENITYPALAS